MLLYCWFPPPNMQLWDFIKFIYEYITFFVCFVFFFIFVIFFVCYNFQFCIRVIIFVNYLSYPSIFPLLFLYHIRFYCSCVFFQLFFRIFCLYFHFFFITCHSFNNYRICYFCPAMSKTFFPNQQKKKMM